MSNFFKMQYGNWTKYHATQDLGPINTWTIPSTTTDVVSYSSEDTISLNGKGGHYETCYKAFTVERSGQYTISYDYNLPTINFYGTDTKYMHFGIFISTNEPPGGNMSTYADYNSGNCNGYEICGTASQYNSPGEGSASFTYNLTAGTTYYLWIPIMNLADGVQTYLTFTNLKWTETAESDLFEPIGILSYDNCNGFLQYENAQTVKTLTLCASNGGTLTANTVTGYAGDTVELTTAYNTYYRFSGYDVTGGTIEGNTFTFGDDDATAYAAFKPNAFTATGGFEKGSDVQRSSTGTKNPINFNIGPLYAIHVSHTGDVPNSWYSTSNRWQPSNVSAYNISLKPIMKFTGNSRGNRPIEVSAGTYVGNTFTQTAKRSENNAGSWTWTYNKSFTSNVQNNYRISAHVSGYGMLNNAVTVNYISTATTGTWSATGYAP